MTSKLDSLRSPHDAVKGKTCAECGMQFKAGVAYGFSCPRGSKCGLLAALVAQEEGKADLGHKSSRTVPIYTATVRVTIKRALEKAGFVHLRSGWVRKEAAPRLQDKIDRAVAEAADGVDAIRHEAEE